MLSWVYILMSFTQLNPPRPSVVLTVGVDPKRIPSDAMN